MKKNYLVISIFYFIRSMTFFSEMIADEQTPQEFKTKNYFLVNSGNLMINRKKIFKEDCKKFGKNACFVMNDDEGFIIVSEKVIKPMPKNTPLFLGRYKLLITEVTNDNIKWQTTCGFKNMNRNNCKKIINTKDGGCLIMGDAVSGLDDNGPNYLMIIKVNNRGIIDWKKIWKNKKNLMGINLSESNEGYIVVGLEYVDSEINASKYIKIFVLNHTGNLIKEYSLKIDKMYTINGVELEKDNIINIFSSNINYEELNKINLKYESFNLKYLFDFEREKEIKFLIDSLYKGSWFNSSQLIKMKNKVWFIVGDIFTPKGFSGIYILYLDNKHKGKEIKIFWNGNNYCYYKGFLKDRDGGFYIYGEIDYKIRDFRREIILMKFDKDGYLRYTQIFGIGNIWNQVEGMTINEKGELIGFFEWFTEENNKLKNYISIEKITIK